MMHNRLTWMLVILTWAIIGLVFMSTDYGQEFFDEEWEVSIVEEDPDDAVFVDWSTATTTGSALTPSLFETNKITFGDNPDRIVFTAETFRTMTQEELRNFATLMQIITIVEFSSRDLMDAWCEVLLPRFFKPKEKP